MILLLIEVFMLNMCYIAYVVIDYNINGSIYVEISNWEGNGIFLGFCSVSYLVLTCRSK